MNKQTTVIILMLCGALSAKAALQDIIPQPRKIEARSNRQFYFRYPEKKIKVKIDPNLPFSSDEAYMLETSPKKITIKAKSKQGLIWAKYTLKQLSIPTKGGIMLPDVKITDYPEFPIRGFMLDNGRNFMEVPLLKHYLQIISFYKLNVFHWHLTDHPGWRIESKAYPQLNKPESMIKGRDEGRFYTYNEIREVISYAKTLGITVIPEIDMPGHSAYFKKAFGFKMESPEGKEVLETCIREFCKEIPQKDCPYLHIGSDEVHIEKPNEFISWAEQLLKNCGRQPIAWEPGLKASSHTIRQIWREETVQGAAIDQETKFIDSYMGYLNGGDPIVFTNTMLMHPLMKSPNNLGGILCLWNDVNATDKTKIAAQNGFLNGLLPFAERFWSASTPPTKTDHFDMPAPNSPNGKYIHEFEQRMVVHRDRFLIAEPFNWVAASDIPWEVSQPLPLRADTGAIKWVKTWGGTLDLRHYLKEAKINDKDSVKLYARTQLFAQADTTIYAWIGFESPSRSSRISGGIGKEGEWENNGIITVNGQKVQPPKWQQPGAYAFKYETWACPEEMISYTDEQFYWMRSPVKINLKKGWNKIDIVTFKTFPGQRWSFSFTPLTVEPNGKLSECKGIRY